MHSFTTERFLIRPLSQEDKALFTNLYTDAKIMRNIGKPLSKEKAEQAFINTLKAMTKTQPKMLTWTIVDLLENKSLGIQALNNITNDSAEIGIMLTRTSHGRLVPEEAMNGLLNYAFNKLQISRVEANYDKRNLATKRFTQKIGFIPGAKTSKHQPQNIYVTISKEDRLLLL